MKIKVYEPQQHFYLTVKQIVGGVELVAVDSRGKTKSKILTINRGKLITESINDEIIKTFKLKVNDKNQIIVAN